MSRRWAPSATNWVGTKEKWGNSYVTDEFTCGRCTCPCRRRRHVYHTTMDTELDPEIAKERWAINREVTVAKYGTWTRPYKEAEVTHHDEWHFEKKDGIQSHDPESRACAITNKKTDETQVLEKARCVIQ